MPVLAVTKGDARFHDASVCHANTEVATEVVQAEVAEVSFPLGIPLISIQQQWSFWVACRVCQFLSVTDLLSFLAASRPGGVADSLRLDSLRDRLASTQAAVFVKGLPIIGSPAVAVTSAVTDLLASKASSSLIDPLYHLAVERVPPEQLLHLCLCAANGIKNMQAVAADSAGSGAGGLAQGIALHAWTTASAKIWGGEGVVSKSLLSQPDPVLLVKRTAEPLVVWSAARTAELRVWLNSLGDLVGMDVLVSVLKSLASQITGSLGRAKKFVVPKPARSSSSSKSASSPPTEPSRLGSESSRGVPVNTRANSLNSEYQSKGGEPVRTGAHEGGEEATKKPFEDQTEESSGGGGSSDADAAEPLDWASSLDWWGGKGTLELYGQGRGLALPFHQLGKLRRRARRRLAGAVRHWTPGGVVALYDFVMTTNISGDGDDSTSFFPLGLGDGISSTRWGGGAAAEGVLGGGGRTPFGSPPLGGVARSGGGGSTAVGAGGGAAGAAELSPLDLHAVAVETAAWSRRCLQELDSFNEQEGMACLVRYVELVPHGIVLGVEAHAAADIRAQAATRLLAAQQKQQAQQVQVQAQQQQQKQQQQPSGPHHSSTATTAGAQAAEGGAVLGVLSSHSEPSSSPLAPLSLPDVAGSQSTRANAAEERAPAVRCAAAEACAAGGGQQQLAGSGSGSAAAPVVAGALPHSPRLLKRMAKMMHYPVSLAPFQVTIEPAPKAAAVPPHGSKMLPRRRSLAAEKAKKAKQALPLEATPTPNPSYYLAAAAGALSDRFGLGLGLLERYRPDSALSSTALPGAVAVGSALAGGAAGGVMPLLQEEEGEDDDEDDEDNDNNDDDNDDGSATTEGEEESVDRGSDNEGGGEAVSAASDDAPKEEMAGQKRKKKRKAKKKKGAKLSSRRKRTSSYGSGGGGSEPGSREDSSSRGSIGGGGESSSNGGSSSSSSSSSGGGGGGGGSSGSGGGRRSGSGSSSGGSHSSRPHRSRRARSSKGGGGSTASPGASSSNEVMCTPQSFPPSPSFRDLVLARSCGLSDDVVYAVRDQLRRALQMQHRDQNVRAVAEYLERRQAMAIFNHSDCASSVVLTRGGHCAHLNAPPPVTSPNPFPAPPPHAQAQAPPPSLPPSVDKSGRCRGSVAGGSVRAMVPVLHNRYVYLQFSVLPWKELSSRTVFNSTTPATGGGGGGGGGSSGPRSHGSSGNLAPLGVADGGGGGGGGGGGNSSSSSSSSSAVNPAVGLVVTVGLSTGDLRLDGSVSCGMAAHSIGLSSDGTLAVGGEVYSCRAVPPPSVLPPGMDGMSSGSSAGGAGEATAAPPSTPPQSSSSRLKTSAAVFGSASLIGMLVYRDNETPAAAANEAGHAQASSSSMESATGDMAAVWAAFTVDGQPLAVSKLSNKLKTDGGRARGRGGGGNEDEGSESFSESDSDFNEEFDEDGDYDESFDGNEYGANTPMDGDDDEHSEGSVAWQRGQKHLRRRSEQEERKRAAAAMTAQHAPGQAAAAGSPVDAGSLVRLLVPRSHVIFPTVTLRRAVPSSELEFCHAASGGGGGGRDRSGSGGGGDSEMAGDSAGYMHAASSSAAAAVMGRFCASDIDPTDNGGSPLIPMPPSVAAAAAAAGASPTHAAPSPSEVSESGLVGAGFGAAASTPPQQQLYYRRVPVAALAAPPDCSVYALDGSVVRPPAMPIPQQQQQQQQNQQQNPQSPLPHGQSTR